ncbi:MAG: YihY/virulence factor BrkB family protein [Chloroflexi bacterium]|nr:YihY/virulence factor BrkB family protein [Chloroflexota bacterium]
MRERLRVGYRILWRSVEDFQANEGTLAAAAIAYFALLSIFPLVLGLIVIVSFFLDPEAAREQIFVIVGQAFPVSREMIETIVADLLEARGTAGLLSVAALLWSGSRIFDALRVVLNRAWGAQEPRGFLLQQAVKGGLLVATVLAMFAVLFAAALARLLAGLEIPFLGVRLADLPLWDVGLSLVPAAATFVVLLVLYRLVPAARVSWRAAAIGAGAGTVLIEVAKQIFYLFIRLGEYNLVYGPLAGGVIFLVWTYFLGVILIYGAEFGKAVTEEIWGTEVAAERRPRAA